MGKRALPAPGLPLHGIMLSGDHGVYLCDFGVGNFGFYVFVCFIFFRGGGAGSGDPITPRWYS